MEIIARRLFSPIYIYFDIDVFYKVVDMLIMLCKQLCIRILRCVKIVDIPDGNRLVKCWKFYLDYWTAACIKLFM